MLRTEMLESEIYYMQDLGLEDDVGRSRGGNTIISFILILSLIKICSVQKDLIMSQSVKTISVPCDCKHWFDHHIFYEIFEGLKLLLCDPLVFISP
jgi:hypothetical protein